jgi:hypothetical protein
MTTLRAASLFAARPGGHLRQELQLVGELVILFRIRNVPAGGDVEVVQLDAGDAGRGVAAVVARAPDVLARRRQAPARQDGDAVVALLAMHHDMRKAEGLHRLQRELLVGDLDLLQADHVGGEVVAEARQVVEALAQGVHVPGGDAKGHGYSRRAGSFRKRNVSIALVPSTQRRCRRPVS